MGGEKLGGKSRWISRGRGAMISGPAREVVAGEVKYRVKISGFCMSKSCLLDNTQFFGGRKKNNQFEFGYSKPDRRGNSVGVGRLQHNENGWTFKKVAINVGERTGGGGRGWRMVWGEGGRGEPAEGQDEGK